MTKICVPVSGSNAREIANKALSSGADLIEIRADLIPNADTVRIEKDFSDILNKSIITLRSKQEGGESEIAGKQREDWLDKVIELNPAYVDLELDTDKKIISKSIKNDTIVSKHLISEWTTTSVMKALTDCCKQGVIGKVAVKVEDVSQSTELLSKVKEASLENFAFMTMGSGGELSRAVSSSIGSKIVYCALSEKQKVAPGQLELKVQKRVIEKDSIVVGLLGHPLGHSLSPKMQNAAFEALDIPGIYLKFDVPDAKKVVEFIKKSAQLGIKGFNVTIPYKEIAFASVNHLDNDARRAGAVNTIGIDSDGSLRGYNTDIFGFSEAIKVSGFNPRNKRALIVGAGGASRAAIIGLWKMGAKMVIANRTPERAEQLVRSMRVFIKTLPLEAIEKEKPFNLIVNATPVGMRGFEGDSIIPDSLVAKADAVMDMVYNPIETPLVALAEKHKIKTIPGLDMLLFQGAKAFEIWTGKNAPVDVMKKKLLEAINK